MSGDFLDDSSDVPTLEAGTGVSDSDISALNSSNLNSTYLQFNADTLVTGDNDPNAYPTLSDNPQLASAGCYSATTQNLLGSVGSVISNLPKTATALGTAVGTAQHNIAVAGSNYSAAQSAASSGNGLATWWQLSSNTDKAMIILAIVGIIVAYEKG